MRKFGCGCIDDDERGASDAAASAGRGRCRSQVDRKVSVHFRRQEIIASMPTVGTAPDSIGADTPTGAVLAGAAVRAGAVGIAVDTVAAVMAVDTSVAVMLAVVVTVAATGIANG
jgi:hypothetical protein